jgi:hypothetical protein
MPDKSLPDLIWENLNGQIADIKKQVDTLQVRTERSETAGGHPSVNTLAEAPTIAGGATGLKGGDELWIGNARKTGQAAGNGTGLIAYYDPATDSWFRPSDDTAVVI